MFRMFFRSGKNVSTPSRKKNARRYRQERQCVLSDDPTVRATLARKADTHPEILYYLAQDENVDVRKAVARNAATPAHASPVLAKDKDVDVRLILASRLIDLLPNISEDQQSQLYAFTVQALGALAHDEVLKIRKALTTALRDHAQAPPQVVGQLARDVERDVSEPILKFCARLSDDDLLDILSNHPEPWVISAIASRDTVSEPVVDMIVDSDDVAANTVLINNTGACYSLRALTKIIEQARSMPEWQKPLALRKELSFSMAEHLSEFVDDSVKKLLKKRRDFDEETKSEVGQIVRRRLNFAEKNIMEEPVDIRIERFISEGRLNDDAISDALAWQDYDFVLAALGRLARIPVPVVKKMVNTKTAKPVVSIAWRAGVSMRLAVELQKQLAQVQPKDLMYARDGVDYPLAPEDMIWQLEFFGIEHRA